MMGLGVSGAWIGDLSGRKLIGRLTIYTYKSPRTNNRWASSPTRGRCRASTSTSTYVQTNGTRMEWWTREIINPIPLGQTRIYTIHIIPKHTTANAAGLRLRRAGGRVADVGHGGGDPERLRRADAHRGRGHHAGAHGEHTHNVLYGALWDVRVMDGPSGIEGAPLRELTPSLSIVRTHKQCTERGGVHQGRLHGLDLELGRRFLKARAGVLAAAAV